MKKEKMNLKKIELILENTESIILPFENILEIQMKKSNDNSIEDLHMEVEYKPNGVEGNIYEKYRYKNILDRLDEHNDICYLALEYLDGKREELKVIWDEGSDDINNYQKTSIKNGILKINIKKRFYAEG